MKSGVTILLLFGSFYLSAQGGMVIGNGADVVAGGNPHIVIYDGKFHNDGTFAAGNSTVYLRGTAAKENSTIGGSANTAFHHLSIAKTNNDARLDGFIQVDGLLIMAGGLFDLNGFDVQLDGSIQGETEATRVIGPDGGELIKTIELNMPSGENPGELGAVITSAANLGLTTIRRGHVPQQDGVMNSIERYFMIEPANNAGLNATLRIYYFDGELAGLDESNLQTWQFENGAWQLLGADNSSMDENWVEFAGISSFFMPTLAEDVSALPIELLFFEARVTGKREIELFWSTDTEINNDYFTIERSQDGATFEPLARVPGAGTTHERQSYRILDQDPLPGLSYYRLRQTDFDGSFTFSTIRVVQLDGMKQPVAYPNPTSTVLYVQLDHAEVFPIPYTLYNQWGQEVMRGEMHASPSALNIGHLSAGVYVVQLQGNGDTSVFRVVKK